MATVVEVGSGLVGWDSVPVFSGSRTGYYKLGGELEMRLRAGGESAVFRGVLVGSGVNRDC